MDQAKVEYAKPPIVEAVIELVFDKISTAEEVEKASKRLVKDYATNEVEQIFETKVDQFTNSVTISQKVGGHRVVSRDRSEFLVIQVDRFVFAQLAPYPGWEAFVSRMKRDHANLKKELGFRRTKRVGVRFINRIDIPRASYPVWNPSLFTMMVPEPPPYGTKNILSYTLRVVNELEFDSCKTQLTTTRVDSPVPDMDALLLDIDVYCDSAIPDNDPEIWALLDRMRKYKNEVFEASITTEARKLFK